MTRQVTAVPPSLLIAHAWELMQSRRIRHLPVVHEGRVVGILSDRDLLRIGNVLPSGELGFVRRHVEDVMTLTPLTCGPATSIGEAARLMTEKKIDALPIVENGRLVGLVTSTDLLHLVVDASGASEERLPFTFEVGLVG